MDVRGYIERELVVIRWVETKIEYVASGAPLYHKANLSRNFSKIPRVPLSIILN